MESAVRKHTGAGLSHVCALLILASVVLPMRASAVGAFGQVFTARQPDGKEFPVRVWGDEYFRVAETLDGYTVTYEPQTPWITYATLSADGTELVSTGVRVVPAQAGNMQVQSTLPNLEKHVRITPESRAEKVANSRRTLMSPTREPGAIAPLAAGDWEPSLQGTVKGVCILIDFSDDPATVNRSAIDDMCNEQGYSGYGNNGSVHDYFYDVSEGVLTYTNHVTSYYRAQNPRTYYDNPSDVFGMGAQVLILEALDWLDSSGFDFSQYDTNGDGYIDALNLFYAGEAPPIWATGLWPHSGGLAYQVDGVETYRYQITNIGSALTIGTFCHENGHMLGGWPDFYDYEYDSIGIGFFCLMSAGNYGDDGRNPVEPNAFLKLISGWATLTVLTQPAQSLPAQAGINQIYKINNAQLATEYFLVENRQQSARDAAVPDAGLAIWHVDENGDRDSQQMTPDAHYVVSLEQADGRFDMEHNENYGDNTDLFRAPQYLAFNDTTLPDAHWWSGQASGISISEISFPRDTITFNFGGGGAGEISLEPETGLDSAGQAGGPFTPNSVAYTLTNGTTQQIQWSAIKAQNWLSVAPSSGTLEASGKATINVSINQQANQLPNGEYLDVVNFAFPGQAATFVRGVRLTIGGGGDDELNRFVWSNIESPQKVGKSFGVTLTAVDRSGSTVADFGGTVRLSAVGQVTDNIYVGSGQSISALPMKTLFHDARSMAIYTSDELGDRSAEFIALSYNVLTAPGPMMNCVLRIKHTTRDSAPGTWDNLGWTTIFSGNLYIQNAGWHRFKFGTPFKYNGRDNLAVEFLFDNNSYSHDGPVLATSVGGSRMMYAYTDSYYESPLSWRSVYPTPKYTGVIPTIRLELGAGGGGTGPVRVSPTTAGPFVRGVWSGQIKILDQAADVIITADDQEGHTGTTNLFTVNYVPEAPGDDETGGRTGTNTWVLYE